jgi:peptide/nickel transport system ATP-binding protein
MMRLLGPTARIVAGEVIFDGRDLLRLDEAAMQRVRGNDIAMIFQEPMTSLNPVLTCGYQIAEVIRFHKGVSRSQAWEQAVEMLRLVRIPEPERRAHAYPHQLSGGMRQRVMIAMALCCNPKLIIADEPTTALDVTIQAQILRLIRDLRERLHSAMILVTHDLGVVAETADRVVVMYAGRKVEEGTAEDIFGNPLHPYTRGLLGAVPKLGSSLAGTGRSKLTEIGGQVPSLRKPIIGCAFAGRCPQVTDFCRKVAPAVEEKQPAHLVACHYAERRLAA